MATPSENFASTVGRDVKNLEDRTRQISDVDDTTLNVIDERGYIAMQVGMDGDVTIPAIDKKIDDVSSRVDDLEGEAGQMSPGLDSRLRVIDQDGYVALEVAPDGQVTIPDLQGYSAGGGGGGEAVEVTELHIFLAAGQSNMAGRGFPTVAPTSHRIFQYGGQRRRIELAPALLDMPPLGSMGTSPASFFAEKYLASQPPHVGVLIVCAARGGTRFHGTPENPVAEGQYTWTKGAAYPGSARNYQLYEFALWQTQNAITAAKEAGFVPILQGVLWHQGESQDQGDPESYELVHYDVVLDQLINNFRTDLESPRLPFMLCRMVPEGIEDNPLRAIVDAHHVATPARVPFTGVGDSPRGAYQTPNGFQDTTHFNTLGNQILGDSYLKAWHQALGNTHI